MRMEFSVDAELGQIFRPHGYKWSNISSYWVGTLVRYVYVYLHKLTVTVNHHGVWYSSERL